MKYDLTFSGYDCNVVKNLFNDGKTPCLSLVAADTKNNSEQDIFPSEPIAKASVFVEDIVLEDGQTIIKNYSENKGIFEALVNSGIVSDTGLAFDVSGGNNCIVHIVNVLI